ncbi:hypothetical protein DFQ26_002021 [Actinomortierella ambigua]|nr:hypothetical protein DFQ26_002021 [Actinomortierella ambigua]
MRRNPLLGRLHAQARALCTECCSVTQKSTNTTSRLSASRRPFSQSTLFTSTAIHRLTNSPHPLLSRRQQAQFWRVFSSTTASSLNPTAVATAASSSSESDLDNKGETIDDDDDLDDLDILTSGKLPPAPPALQQLRDRYLATKESDDPQVKKALLAMYHAVARDPDLLAQMYPVDFLQAMYAAKALHSLPGMRRVLEDVGKTTAYRGHPSFYHVMLRAYLSRSDFVQSEYIWRLMKRRKVRLTQASFHIMLHHCKARRNSTMALSLLRQMDAMRIPVSAYTYVLLLGVCFRRAKASLAQQLFDEMPGRGLDWTAYHFSTLLATYAKAKDRVGALRVLDDMQDHGFAPNAMIYNSLLSVTEDWTDRQQMFLDFVEQGLQPDIRTMIAMRAPLTEILQRMEEGDDDVDDDDDSSSSSSTKKKSKMKVTREDFNVLLTTALKHSKTGLMMDVLDAMKKRHFQPDAFTFSTLMDAFVKVGEYGQARDIFEGVVASEMIVPDVVVYTNAISAALGQSDTMGALQIIKRMLGDGLMPNSVTMNLLLTAMVSGQYANIYQQQQQQQQPQSKDQASSSSSSPQQPPQQQQDLPASADSIEMAELVINLMRQNGIREDVRSCNILLSAYARANEPEKMMRAFRRMTHELHIAPELLTYETLILGHLRSGNLRFAVDMYFAMRRERNFYGHSAVHNQLLSALVASGQAQQVLQLWRDLARSDRSRDEQSFRIMLDACDRFGLVEHRGPIEEDFKSWREQTVAPSFLDGADGQQQYHHHQQRQQRQRSQRHSHSSGSGAWDL